MTAYRGKYPQNIRTVSCGRDRIVHIYTMNGDHFTCTMEQARYVNTKALPNPGDDSTPYRNASAMPIVSLTVSTPARDMLRDGTAVTQSHRIAAIRRFLDDVSGTTDQDWIGERMDRLQCELGSVHGHAVAIACGFNFV